MLSKSGPFGTQGAAKKRQKVLKKSKKKCAEKTLQKNVFFQKPCISSGFGMFLGGQGAEKGSKKE